MLLNELSKMHSIRTPHSLIINVLLAIGCGTEGSNNVPAPFAFVSAPKC